MPEGSEFYTEGAVMLKPWKIKVVQGLFAATRDLICKQSLNLI